MPATTTSALASGAPMALKLPVQVSLEPLPSGATERVDL